MLPNHLTRLLYQCVTADYFDPAARQHIINACIPPLRQHRRELLAGSFEGRHARPAGYIQRVIDDSTMIRKALQAAHEGLTRNGAGTRVVSLNAKRQTAAQTRVA